MTNASFISFIPELLLQREINEHERFFKIRKLTDRLIERRARNLGRLEWERREALKCSNERNENDMVNKKGYMVTGIDLPETHPSNSKNGKQGTECNESNDDNTYYSSTISYSSETVGEDKGKGNGVAAYEAILEEHRKNQIGNKFENVPIPIALKAEFEKDSMYKNMEQIRKLAGFKPGLKRISNVSIIDPKISYEYYKDTSRELLYIFFEIDYLTTLQLILIISSYCLRRVNTYVPIHVKQLTRVHVVVHLGS